MDIPSPEQFGNELGVPPPGPIPRSGVAGVAPMTVPGAPGQPVADPYGGKPAPRPAGAWTLLAAGALLGWVGTKFFGKK